MFSPHIYVGIAQDAYYTLLLRLRRLLSIENCLGLRNLRITATSLINIAVAAVCCMGLSYVTSFKIERFLNLIDCLVFFVYIQLHSQLWRFCYQSEALYYKLIPFIS